MKKRATGWGVVVAVALLAGPGVARAASRTSGIRLEDVKGQTADLHALVAGRPTMLVFWATWCGPCAEEVPALKRVAERFGPAGLNLLAINPAVRDDLASVRRYVTRYELNYPVYIDPAHLVLRRFAVHATPTIVLLDAAGREVARSHEVDEAAVAALLARNGSASLVNAE